MYPQVASEDSKPAAYYHPPAAATGLPVSHGSAAPYSTGLPVSHSSTTAYSTASSDYHAPLPPPRPKPVDWSTGLCDCFSDTKTCCITCWCPCITFGQVAEIVDKGSTSCGASGALYTLICCVIGCGCLYSCFYRSKMRQQQNLKGNNCLDCLIHCCCEPCALCQEYRQLENQGFDMVIGWHGNVEQRSRGIAMSTSTAPPPAEQGMSR